MKIPFNCHDSSAQTMEYARAFVKKRFPKEHQEDLSQTIGNAIIQADFLAARGDRSDAYIKWAGYLVLANVSPGIQTMAIYKNIE